MLDIEFINSKPEKKKGMEDSRNQLKRGIKRVKNKPQNHKTVESSNVMIKHMF